MVEDRDKQRVRKESTLQVKAGNMICYEKENWKSKMTSKGVGTTSLLKISKMEFERR